MSQGAAPRIVLRTTGGVSVTVRGSQIVPAGGPSDLTLDVGDAAIRPGLINAHDHLHRNHLPRLGTPPYQNAYAWGTDLHATCQREIGLARQLSRDDALLFGALKNLAAGVTTVVHHDAWEPAFDRRFPLKVPRVQVAHSLRFEPRLKETAAKVWGGPEPRRILCVHLAEGIDSASAEEIHEADHLGLLTEGLLAVHLVGVDSGGVRLLRQRGVTAVWCPTSNTFLFHRQPPRELFESGIPILLGSDALLTGQGTLLDELRAARQQRLLPDELLVRAVGDGAARALGLPPPTLHPGGTADITVVTQPLFHARPRDVRLVLVDGSPRFADPIFADLFDLLGVPTEELIVGKSTKLVAAPLATVARRATALFAGAGRFLS